MVSARNLAETDLAKLGVGRKSMPPAPIPSTGPQFVWGLHQPGRLNITEVGLAINVVRGLESTSKL